MSNYTDKEKKIIKDILESNFIYFLTNMEEKNRLLSFISML